MLMLDVEYLLERPSLGKPVVYRYRTGVLRRKILDACRKAADDKGCYLASAVLGSESVSLFAEVVPFYDWALAKRGDSPAFGVRAALHMLVAGGDGACVHFVPMTRGLIGEAFWPAIEKSCCVIDEPEIAAATLGPILRYLEANTDLAQRPKLLAQPGFVESFDILFDKGKVELPELMRAFDERVLLSTDPVTGQFDPAPYRRAALELRGRYSPTRKLREFLRYRDGKALVDLVLICDQRHFNRGDTASAMMKDLYHATRNVLDKPGWPEPDEREQGLSLVLWAALTMAWERHLLSASSDRRLAADIFITNLEGLGRDFLVRDVQGRTADCLAGLWHELYLSLSMTGHHQPAALTEARTMMLLALDRFLMTMMQSPQPRWLEVLFQRVREAVLKLEHVDEVAEFPDVA